jgi:kumamolisin
MLRAARPLGAAIWGGLFVKPIATAARRRAGALVTIGTAGSLMALGAGSAVAATQPPSAARAGVPQGIGAAALQNASIVGQTAAGARETVSFVLVPRNLQRLQASVNAGMPGGHLSAARFASRFGQTPAHISALTRFLAQHHITSRVHTDRLDITTTGRVLDYNAALGVQQKNFQLAAVAGADGQPGRAATVFHGTAQPATLPKAVAGVVESVLGLTNYPIARDQEARRPRLTPGPHAAGSLTGNLTPASFASRYNLTPLLRRGFRGQGQTIGIVTLASMSAADATHFWSKVLKIRTKARRLTLDNIDGGAGQVAYKNGSSETTLDVEQSGALAPQASIVVYQAPNTDAGFIDAFATAASQNKASAVSSSWGESEDLIASSIAAHRESRAYAGAFDEIFLELAAQGQSSFIASGDSGAYDSSAACVFTKLVDKKKTCMGSKDLSVDYPGTSPWTTAAGGMTLAGAVSLGGGVTVTVPTRRAWGYDYLWPMWPGFGASSEFNLVRNGFVGGGGGGYSRSENAPGYQTRWLDTRHFTAVLYLKPITPITQHNFTRPVAWAFNAHPGLSTGVGSGRAVPDVSADADPFTGYEVYFSKFPGAKLQAGVGGTSFVAPQFAGATAVMNSYLHRRVGFWNPAVYRFAAGGNSPFAAVETVGTSNDNLYYTGTAGHRYNPAVGLGTPNFAKLAAAYKG